MIAPGSYRQAAPGPRYGGVPGNAGTQPQGIPAFSSHPSAYGYPVSFASPSAARPPQIATSQQMSSQMPLRSPPSTPQQATRQQAPIYQQPQKLSSTRAAPFERAAAQSSQVQSARSSGGQPDQAAAAPVLRMVSSNVPSRGSLMNPSVQRTQSVGEAVSSGVRLNSYANAPSSAAVAPPAAVIQVAPSKGRSSITPMAAPMAVPVPQVPVVQQPAMAVRRGSLQGALPMAVTKASLASSGGVTKASLASSGGESPKKKVGFTGRDSFQAVPQVEPAPCLTMEALQRLTGQDGLPARRRSSAYTQRSSIAGSEFWEDDTMDDVQNRACTKLEKKLVAKGLR